MPETTNWWTIAGVVFAGISAFAGVAVLFMPKVRAKLGLSVTKSQRVEMDLKNKPTGSIKVDKSSDVNIKIGK